MATLRVSMAAAVILVRLSCPGCASVMAVIRVCNSASICSKGGGRKKGESEGEGRGKGERREEEGREKGGRREKEGRGNGGGRGKGEVEGGGGRRRGKRRKKE